MLYNRKEGEVMYIVYGLMCLLFGTTFLAIKIGVDAGVPPFFFAGTRFLAAGVIVLMGIKILGGKIRLQQKKIWDVSLVGVFMTAVMFGCLYWGERYISSSVAALLAATTPIMIAIVEWIQGVRENVWMKGCGLLLSFIGVVIAVLPALGVEVTKEAILAVVAILGAEIGCVFGTMKSKKIFTEGLSPFLLNGWQMVIGGMILVLLSMLVEPRGVIMNDQVAFSWIYLVICGSLIGHGSYYWLVRRAGPLLPSTWTYISPVIAQFVGYYFLAEYVSVYSFLGLSLVLSGVFLVSRAGILENWLKEQLKKAVTS
jgi:drug/metabolite transporter (DMT)-like permease